MDLTKFGCQNEGVNPFVSEMNILVLQVCAYVTGLRLGDGVW